MLITKALECLSEEMANVGQVQVVSLDRCSNCECFATAENGGNVNLKTTFVYSYKSAEFTVCYSGLP